MVKKSLKIVLRIFIVIMVILGLYLSYCFYQYQQIKADRPLNELVQQIQSNPDFVTIDEINETMIKSVVATEDRRFYNRNGFDMRAFLRAISTNIQEGEFVQGGSTIPQQVGKLLYFDHLQTLEEKVIQVFVMYDLEDQYTKDEILELYLNSIFFGQGYHGIKQASNGYYQIDPSELNWAQSSLLAGVIAAPSAYEPRTNFDLAKQRQVAVLISLRDVYDLSQQQIDQIYESEIVIY